MTIRTDPKEIVLMTPLSEGNTLDDTIKDAHEEGRTIISMGYDRVSFNREYPIPLPVLYLTKGVPNQHTAVIVQGPSDDMYRLFEFRMIG